MHSELIHFLEEQGVQHDVQILWQGHVCAVIQKLRAEHAGVTLYEFVYHLNSLVY